MSTATQAGSEATPDFREEAATPVVRWGFGLWSDKWASVADIPDGGKVSLYSDPADDAQDSGCCRRRGRPR